MLFYLKKILSYISVFFIHGALSDRDIRKMLGKQIYIYPFDEKNLKGGSYNLTASKYAIVREGKKEKLIVNGDKIIIPKGKTAIIETNESIYVSDWISGTYHSRVKLVNKGIGHIGTTLDPNFFGISAIALQNTTNEDITIKVGESIATIMFYTLKSRSTGNHDNMPGHINEIHLDTIDFYEGLNEKSKLDELVCEKCCDCKESEHCSYKLIKNEKAEKERIDKILKGINKWRSQPWITSKSALKKYVIEQVKYRDTIRDIVLYSIGILFIGGCLMYKIYTSIGLDQYKDIKDTLNALLTGIPSAVVIIIGWISSYKMYCKREYEKKQEKQNKGEK